MSNKMLIDAIHPEETRVVVVRDKRVEDFDFEAASRKPLRGNIYLAKVTRVEPSLQAAFIEYGGNRHGFLAFSEIHPDYYQIPQADRAALIAEERDGDDDDEDRGAKSGGGNGSRRRRGGRSGRRETGNGSARRGGETEAGERRASADDDETPGVVEVVYDDEDDDGDEIAADEGGIDAAGGETAAASRDEAEPDSEADDSVKDPAAMAAPAGEADDEDDDGPGIAASAVADDSASGSDDSTAGASGSDDSAAGASGEDVPDAGGAGTEDESADAADTPVEPASRPSVVETGEVTSGEIAAEIDAGVSSDYGPSALDRARRQVEENIEADTAAAIDNPIREIEVPDGTMTPDHDSAGRTLDDVRDPPVARNAAAVPSTADVAADVASDPEPGIDAQSDDEAATADAPAKPAAKRRAPRKSAKKAAEPDAAPKAKSAVATFTADVAAALDDQPSAETAAGDAGNTGEDEPAPKKKRRAPARRTTKKSADGLVDPQITDDDDENDGLRGDDSGSVTSVGSPDALEEVQERRRSAPRRQYKIQEVIKRRQILLVQVVKEERGGKGAALTTYLSLAGRYSVLMPNTNRGGGVSRKITDNADRRRLKELVGELEVPDGMGIILRTAGAARTKVEIRRDFEYLLRLWESVRELTLKSMAPQLVYEEGNLVKRAIRDLYSKEIEEIHVSGEAAYKEARDFMQMLMPAQASTVKPYREPTPIFTRYGVESQLDAMFSPQVTLPSRGYIVINPTEALVSIDVNSGRSTKEHSIEDTALKTNLEAADEVARQLRLRDLAGLIVIDFIDMDDKRHNRLVEKRIKDALAADRSRIQIGRISPFGLLEMSRQRTRQGMVETSMVPCAICAGTGHVRSTPSVALHCLRTLEEHLLKDGEHHVMMKTSAAVALYILNQKRSHLNALEERFALDIEVHADETLSGQHLEIVAGGFVERLNDNVPQDARVVSDDAGATDIDNDGPVPDDEDEGGMEVSPDQAVDASAPGNPDGQNAERSGRRRRRRRRRGSNGDTLRSDDQPSDEQPLTDAAGGTAGMESDDDELDDDEDEDDREGAGPSGDHEPAGEEAVAETTEGDGDGEDDRRGRRRRGRRGGRRHRREGDDQLLSAQPGTPGYDGNADDPAPQRGSVVPFAVGAEQPWTYDDEAEGDVAALPTMGSGVAGDLDVEDDDEAEAVADSAWDGPDDENDDAADPGADERGSTAQSSEVVLAPSSVTPDAARDIEAGDTSAVDAADGPDADQSPDEPTLQQPNFAPAEAAPERKSEQRPLRSGWWRRGRPS